jgi:ATP-dependent Clp protease ATP-binding subunit ClpC
MPPEFLNRIDEIIVFNRLTDDDLRQIIDLLVNDLNTTLQKHNLIVTLSDAAIKHVLKSTVSDRSYGARPLRRAIQKLVEDPLAELMLKMDSMSSGNVHFDTSRNDDCLEPIFIPVSSLKEDPVEEREAG